jgi:hypothetical protein
MYFSSYYLVFKKNILFFMFKFILTLGRYYNIITLYHTYILLNKIITIFYYYYFFLCTNNIYYVKKYMLFGKPVIIRKNKNKVLTILCIHRIGILNCIWQL